MNIRRNIPFILIIAIFTFNCNTKLLINGFSYNKLNIKNDDVFVSTTIAETTMEITASCFSTELDQVVFVGDWSNFVIWHRLFPSSLTINIMGLSESKFFNHHKRPYQNSYRINDDIVKRLRYPAKIFIVSMANRLLNDTLVRIKRSILWNSEAIFFLVDENSKNQCSNVKPSLLMSWRFNILRALYICHDIGQKPSIYTFNPFTNLAPKSWQIIGQVNDVQVNHPTRFFRLLNNSNFNKNTCESLVFDKFTVINNYPIKLVASLESISLPIDGSATSNLSINDLKGLNADIARIIWRKLRTSPMISMSGQGYIDDKGTPHGILVHLMYNLCDMGMNQMFFRDFWRLETYPHGYTKIFALHQKVYHPSTVISLPKIFESSIISTLVIICMLVTLYLKYLLKIDIALASFKTLKMLLGMSMGKVPRGTMDRINFAFLFLFMFNMSVYLQSMLTSSLSAPENKIHIDDKEDLEAVIPHEYTIAGPAYIKEFIDNVTLAPYLINSSIRDCVSKIHLDSKLVCLVDSFSIDHYVKSHKNIHISRESIQNVQLSLVIREDWPLRERINQLMQKLREAGVIANLMVKDQIKSHRALRRQTQDYNSTDSDLKRLTLESLKFDFQILVIGIFSSFVVLIIEKTISKLYYKKRIDNLKMFQKINAVAKQ